VIAFDVPAALACPDPACERTFSFALRVEFAPADGGNRVQITPHADAAFLSFTGHLIGDHGLDIEHLEPAGIAAWAHEQVWAAAHAANFDLGRGMREQGYRLDDTGGWTVPA
jgi:hypothetical protein